VDKINKDNLNNFINYYHSFHDSYITNINYDINNSKIELYLDIVWSGEPILKEDNTYETNKTKLFMIFNNVQKYSCKEFFNWDYIDEMYLNFINLDNKELICFANNKNNPDIYIVCNDIFYEEIK